MSKKETQNVHDRICEMIEQGDKGVVSIIEKFYPYGTLASFSFSTMPSPLTPLLTQAKAKATDPHAPDQKLLADACQQIRNCVQQGKPESVEIQLNKAQQVSDKCIYPLGNTAIKILPPEGEPFYLFMKAGDTLDASIFLGGSYGGGVMLIRDENGDDFFLGLSEFHMLSSK